MKECKYCAAQMEEESNFCPNCGKPWEEEVPAEETAPVEEAAPAEETAPVEEAAPAEEAAVTEETAEVEVRAGETQAEAAAEEAPAGETPAGESKEGAKASSGKIGLIVAAVVLVLAVLVALLVKGSAGTEVPQETEAPAASEPVDLMATEATIPADGNPEDVTCKGSYTADDETVIAAGDTVVATMGDAQLTVSQLQVYYWLEVNNFLNMLYNYGMDASYYGLDYTLGLDYQSCMMAGGMTWQQFFLESALGSWQNYQALAMEAKAAGYALEESRINELDNLEESLDLQAQSYGLSGAKELLALNVGNCAEMEDYHFFLENNYYGGGYLDSLVKALELTDEDLETYFTEHEAEYNENGLTRELRSIDVRHILVFPEGADNSTIRTETFSEEAWAAGEAKANEILELYLAGELTEESFAALANEHSADPGSNTNGGLYTEVMQGDMVPEFDAWCFDEARQVGDTAVVRTSLGFHVMYFSGSNVLWPTYVRQDMQTEYQQNCVTAAVEKYEMTVDYSAIVLGFLDLAA